MTFKLNTYTLLFILGLALVSCNNTKKENQITEPINAKEPVVEFKNEGHKLVYNMIEKVGNYKKLRSKKDVIYTFTYTTPAGKTDITTEKYIFDGELSYGKYNQHQRTLPELEGIIEQGYDGKEFWIKHNGTLVKDSLAIKKAMFSRPTHFYWFTMFQKLLDPGIKYDFLKEESLADSTYNIVKISYESNNSKPTDTYKLYINEKTGLVDKFLFTVVDRGMVDTPLLLQLEYKTIDGMLMPTKRKYKKSDWNAKVTDAPWILVNWSDIKFNNGLTKDDFKK